MHVTKTNQERVLIIGGQTQEWTDFQFDNLMAEMEALVETAGGLVLGQVRQKLTRLDPKTGLGKGKLEEIRQEVLDQAIDLVVCLNRLKPIVQRHMEDRLQVPVVDRVQLILDIFAMRARSREGKLQVELAQNQYLLPRIVGQGKYLSRLGGGIGTRGPGETKLETDRRYLRNRISHIKQELKEIENHRQRTRNQRRKGKEYNLGLVGYTNAGKSTILSKLSDSKTYIQDQLFATLDPLTRNFEIRHQSNFTITDTVGFIEELPTELIHAFRSTLEEIQDVDLILHVIDASHPARYMHQKTVQDLLLDLGMQEIPVLVVYNKMDLAGDNFIPDLHPHVKISAYQQGDIEALKEAIWQACINLSDYYRVRIDMTQGQEVHYYQSQTMVEAMDFDEELQAYIISGYQKRI